LKTLQRDFGRRQDRAAQLIKFKVYMTYLLEGKDSRAQKMMERFNSPATPGALRASRGV
jgi:hypothetical protein